MSSKDQSQRLSFLKEMVDTPLQTHYDTVDQAQGEHIIFDPVPETWPQSLVDETSEVDLGMDIQLFSEDYSEDASFDIWPLSFTE